MILGLQTSNGDLSYQTAFTNTASAASPSLQAFPQIPLIVQKSAPFISDGSLAICSDFSFNALATNHQTPVDNHQYIESGNDGIIHFSEDIDSGFQAASLSQSSPTDSQNQQRLLHTGHSFLPAQCTLAEQVQSFAPTICAVTAAQGFMPDFSSTNSFSFTSQVNPFVLPVSHQNIPTVSHTFVSLPTIPLTNVTEPTNSVCLY